MDFFSRTFNFTESEGYDVTRRKLLDIATIDPADRAKYGGETPERFTFAVRDGAVVHGGVFSNPSVNELEAILKSALAKAPDSVKQQLQGHSVLNMTGESRGLHLKPETEGAVVQAASQFNYLEFASPHAVPEQGISMYVYDRTQGPACAIACAAGTAVRNYLARVTPEGDRGQQAGNQFNGMRDVEGLLDAANPQRYFTVRNGYVESDEARLTALNDVLAKNSALADEMIRRLRIGVQWHTQVTDVDGTPPVLVTQTYNSALSVGYSSVAADLWAPLARIVLRGSYRATMLVGAINALHHLAKADEPRLPLVLLTKVGGGVFGNEQDWIKDAIRESVSHLSSAHAVSLPTRIVHYGYVEGGYEEFGSPS